jgi:anti-sigma28 factor (negative regulator of flagellin synthesis)
MRIDPTSPTVIASREEKAPAKPAAKHDGDVVQLSVAASAPVEHDMSQRISQIRALLQRGAYPVDLDALASRIVDDELARQGKQ